MKWKGMKEEIEKRVGDEREERGRLKGGGESNHPDYFPLSV